MATRETAGTAGVDPARDGASLLTRPDDLLDAVAKTPVIINEDRPQGGGVAGERRTPHDEEGPTPSVAACTTCRYESMMVMSESMAFPSTEGDRLADNSLLRQSGQTLDEYRLGAEMVIDQATAETRFFADVGQRRSLDHP